MSILKLLKKIPHVLITKGGFYDTYLVSFANFEYGRYMQVTV